MSTYSKFQNSKKIAAGLRELNSLISDIPFPQFLHSFAASILTDAEELHPEEEDSKERKALETAAAQIIEVADIYLERNPLGTGFEIKKDKEAEIQISRFNFQIGLLTWDFITLLSVMCVSSDFEASQDLESISDQLEIAFAD